MSIFAAFLFTSDITAQDTTSSLAFRNNRPRQRITYFYQPDLSYRIWQQFKLVREAKAGDPLAMHELGIRYLIGEGFPADTVQAAHWIGKAAELKLTAAEYNFGILLNNGWGIKWNPFKAYDYFRSAAEDGMPQAEYIFGILNTNDLILNKNWDLAYNWVKKAADAGYSPAKEALPELLKHVSPTALDTTKSHNGNEAHKKFNPTGDDQSLASNLGLVFIDFSSKTDSVPVISNKKIIHSILINSNTPLSDTLGITEKNDSSLNVNKVGLPYLVQCAEAGNPEALTLIGKLYESGIYFSKNIYTASYYYIRATRLDSPNSVALLWYLIRTPGYFANLKKLVDKKDPTAMYVWYGLYVTGFDHQFTDADAINLLTKSANLDYEPSLVELGLAYLTGKIVKRDEDKAVTYWTKAVELGSMEAAIRLAAGNVLGEITTGNREDSIKELFKAEKFGSVLAQVALAYCYENGVGLTKRVPQAVMYYRQAAQRGNRFAYNELKRMYDQVRPADFR